MNEESSIMIIIELSILIIIIAFIAKKYKRKILITLLVVIFLTPILGLPIGIIISNYFPTQNGVFDLYMFGLDNIKDFYTFWITLFGVPAIGYNIYQNQRRITNQDKQIELQTKEQRESRFAKGLELLGNVNDSTRIGGIYILYYLSKDFEHEYRQVVVDILCSHIRNTTRTIEYQDKNKNKPSSEIATILKILLNEKDQYVLAIGSDIDLEGSYLKGCYLCDVNLSLSNVSKVDFSNCHLLNVDFSDTTINKANFTRADIRKTNFSNANIRKTNFSNATIDETFFTDAVIFQSLFIRMKSFKTIFSDATIDETDFTGADIEKISPEEIVSLKDRTKALVLDFANQMINTQKDKQNSTFKKNIFWKIYKYLISIISTCPQTVIDAEKQLVELHTYLPDSLETIMEKLKIKEAVNNLKEELQIPFLMYLYGYTYYEIADKLNLSIGTVKSRIFFARYELQKELHKNRK